MKRKDFLKIAGIGMGGMMIPLVGTRVEAFSSLTGMSVSDKKALADTALNAAKMAGASYADIRIGRYLNQFIITREQQVQNAVNTESFGVGVRVIANGTWGFASTNNVTNEGVAEAAQQAVMIAKANGSIQSEPVQLAPVDSHGEVSWKTPIKKNAFEVPISEKVDFLLEVNNAAMQNGASFVGSNMFLVNEQKYFASTEGSYIDQDVHRIWPTFNVSLVDRDSGTFESIQSLSSPMGMGYEYLDGNESEKAKGVVTRYGQSYDMIEDAAQLAEKGKEKLSAKSVEPGQYDLVLDPSHLWLTIHENVGHPLELDRVLGYEANYAGTSFATLDKWESGDFEYGSDIVNLYADKLQKGSLGHVGYDDEGVQTKKWDLVKDGILVNYQAIRDQAHIINEDESHGCCYADSWNSVQFQRMPNVSLAPGKDPLSVDDMIKDVENGIYVVGDGSYSIDQQRYNFQFGGQLFYEIKNGEITGMLRDVAYQSNTQEFWNSCSAICDESDFRLGGSFFDGKGQPGQSSAVSHGSSTTRFDGINVINTARRI
ncbi:TldD/PmbA family protein [Gracilimonas halophila]|uniref:TldD/PmbA family protein n=1 Tax=Gracilimonas halophila TaxID=1834464 RepID=A0ABW5JFK9_9BACT